jgi:hypothetical protein
MEPGDQAADIAHKALRGEYDLLLACRDITALRADLSAVPKQVMDVLVAISSEIDDLPVGPESEHWNADALQQKQGEADKYREDTAETITLAMKRLLQALGVGQIREQ